MKRMLSLLSNWMSISTCEMSFMMPTESILEKLSPEVADQELGRREAKTARTTALCPNQ